MRSLMQGIGMTAVAATIALSASAQSPVDKNMSEIKNSYKMLYVDRGDTTTNAEKEQELIDVFYYNQFRHYQDEQAPYFMFMSKSANMAMGVGGVVNMQAWYDFDGTLNGPGFTPYDIYVPVDPASRIAFGTSPTGTKLFFSLFGKSSRLGNYQVFIQGKFNGSGAKDFKLNKAYAIVGDWTVGYANSTFTDPAAQPNTVDPQGPNAEISDTNVLLRYMHQFKSGLAIAGAIETPNADIPEADGLYKSCSDFMPNVAALVQYQWGAGQHVRLSGVVRGLKYRDLVKNQNNVVMGWGAHLSTVFRPVDPLTVYGSVEVGKGISSLVNDLQNDPLDLLPDASDPGKMKAPLSYGWYAALQYNFAPNVYASAIFGHERFAPEASMRTGDMYKYGLYATANVFWEITTRFQVGMEYNWGKRCNFDGTHGQVNRLSLLASFHF